MSDLEILLPAATTPLIASALKGKFTVHNLHEAADPDAFLAEIGPRARAMVTGGLDRGKIDAALMSRLPRLELIAHLGVGYDKIDVAAAAARGIVVTNTPDVLNDEVADLAMGLMLATVRRLPQADAHLRAGHWAREPFPLTASLKNRVLGILGLGRIGMAIATRATPFGLSIAYHNRRPRSDTPFTYYPSVLDLARVSDILMVVAPGTAETRNIVDAAVLQALGPDGILVNVARGSLVDEPALIEALRTGMIHAAGLDVFAAEPHVPAELVALDNVVLLPHVGSASHATRAAMGQLVVDNVMAWAAGRRVLTPVPETPVP
jgi:lactate dehydrogenase-like 2-hydroxyacid dehydrogenase